MRVALLNRGCVLAFALFAASASHAQESGIDPSIKPGDDFFAYANGQWLKETTIPPGKDRWGARNEIEARTREQLAHLFDEKSAASSSARKVLAFRAAYANRSAIEKRGLAPIQPLLAHIEQVQDKLDLARLLGLEIGADVDPLDWGIYSSSHLFGLSVEHGIHGETRHFAYLLQGGLGLRDRDRYLSLSPEMQMLRSQYRDYIGQLFESAGFDHAKERAERIVELETQIAKSHSTSDESGNEKNADNLWSRADFTSQAPGIDWNAFFGAAGLSKQEKIVAWQPNAIKGEAALIASQPVGVWKDYLRFHVMDRYAEVLPKAFADIALAFRNLDAPGAIASSHDQRAIDAASNALPEIVGRMYVDEYFSARVKTRVQKIVGDVIAVFSQRIESVEWMTPAAKSEAIAKLKTLYFGVGYPESWSDATGLKIRADDAFGNWQRVSDWSVHSLVRKLDRPANFKEWSAAPHKSVGILNFSENAYNFTAALLQPPKFDPNASDAMNYGAIGAIIGHEVSHFIDTLGADYDATGATRHWWSAEDLDRYKAATEPLAKQFSNYRPFPDLAVDGKASLVENVADLGGLAAAFEAHRRSLGEKVSDKQFVRQQDRQFFIGFARSWRIKPSDEALRKQAASDHAPERYRIATVRNMDAWYAAFDVTPGQKLYLDPKARVRVW